MAWEEVLAKNGYRLTAPRRAILLVLQRATQPLTPEEILVQARELHPSVGLVTVYRTLDLLGALDLVRCAHREKACHGFLPATQGHHHVIICQNCHRALEFPGDEDLEGLFRRIEERTGYRVCDHLLQLAGLCPACQQEATD